MRGRLLGPDIAAQAAARSARVVLDISMGCTSRNALIKLGVPDNPNVRVLDRLHAKIYVAEDCAIEEAGVWIGRREDPAAYNAAKSLCARYWKSAKVAGRADLERAAKAPTFLPARDRAPEAGPAGSIF